MTPPFWFKLFLASGCLFFGACYGLYWQIKRNAKDRAEVDAENAGNKRLIDSLDAAQHEALNGGKGREGELKLALAVDRVMENMSLGWSSNTMMGFPNAILLPEGNDPYSKELDFVLLCDLGIFAFEVKDWHGTWQQSDDPKFIETMRGNSEIDKRPAPLPKIQSKLALLMRKLGYTVPCEALVVFTDPASSLSAHLPAQYMHINELDYYFRFKRDNTHAVTDVTAVLADLKKCFDTDPNAMHMHMLRLSPSNDLIKGYHERDKQLTALKKRPHLGYPEPRKYGPWIKAALVFFLLSFAAQWFGPK